MKRVALLGMPNTGKSTYFNRLTGAGAKVGNWPGITVDLLSSKIILGSEMLEIVDLPGIYNLHGYSDDEAVARHFLEQTEVDLLIVIANATQLDRQLALTLQLKDLGLPIVLLLNMEDEADQLGIRINLPELQQQLQCPVLQMSAKYGKGIEPTKQAIEQELAKNTPRVSADFSGDDQMENRVDKLFERSVDVPISASDRLTDKIDKVLLHPWFGMPLFFLALLLMFEAVYTLGAPLQDGVAWMLEQIKQDALQPALQNLPILWQNFLLDGVFEGVGTVLSFLPIIVLFFLFMSIIEDSGYMSRAAFLMDAFMCKMGLDGRAFVIQMMGFGCNVPALMGTRVMRSRGLRLLTMLIIPFSLCTARLQVFVFFTTALFSPFAAPLVLFSLYIASFAASFLTAMLYRGQLTNSEPLLLELPPYRFPTFRQMLYRGWFETRHFIRAASGFILIGVILVWFLTNYPFHLEAASSGTWAGQLAAFFEPIFTPVGINDLMIVTLIFGFIAKEIVLGAMAVIYSVGDTELANTVAANMDWIQAYSFMLFVLIYTPCVATVAVIQQESKSWKFTTLSVFWPLVLAWLTSFCFYQVARFLQ